MNIDQLEQIELQRKDKLPIQHLQKSIIHKSKLHIVYIMVWTKVCGGSKIILEYVNRLTKMGHQITLITYDKKPTWFELDSRIEFISLNNQQKLEENIPNCDLIVATSWKNIYSAIKANCAPVVYFEQGGSHIFAIDTLSPIKKEIVNRRIKEATFIYTVSEYSKSIIQKEYGKEAFVVPNAVDKTIFYPKKEQHENIVITTIGPEEFEFKHVDNIIKAIEKVNQKYSNIVFNWISQTKPTKHDISAIVNPLQQKIGEILRNTDIYICASDYESFGLPVLEAMSCGTTVITTDNGGVMDFVENKKNGLIVKKNDIADIVEKITTLIENKALRKKLAQEAIKTAGKFDWNTSVKMLEKYYFELASYTIKK